MGIDTLILTKPDAPHKLSLLGMTRMVNICGIIFISI